jgi:hypothetical protein
MYPDLPRKLVNVVPELGPVLVGLISQENSNVYLVVVPRSCNKLSHVTKRRCHKKEPFVTCDIVFGICDQKGLFV